MVSSSECGCLQERLRQESLERERQIEQDRLNSKLNEKKRQEVGVNPDRHLSPVGLIPREDGVTGPLQNVEWRGNYNI